MRTLDFNAFYKNVDGTETETKLSKSLADLLASETTGNAVKILGWVEKLNKDGVLELDEADEKTLEDTVKNSTRMIALLKGQLQRVFLKKD